MYIADRKRISLSYLMETYTDREIEYWKFYYSKEPTSTEKMEYVLTQFISLFYNKHWKEKKPPSEFAYPNQWKTEVQKDVEAIRFMLTGK